MPTRTDVGVLYYGRRAGATLSVVAFVELFVGMLRPLVRKVRTLAADPVLRRWVTARGFPRSVSARASAPAYLDGLLPLAPEPPQARFAALAEAAPARPIVLPLAGEELRLEPGDAPTVFERRFADPETLESLHRFAWLPLLGDKADPAWVQALWRAWRAGFATPADNVAWQAYSAAERAVNVLDYGQRRGLPGPAPETAALLAQHGPAIAERLEYFGDEGTSNHLAANGRGLYLLGLHLGLPRCTEIGARILLQEAQRIFRPSGVLREGSSHYHLLLAKQYASAWLAARARGRPEAADLAAVVRRALAVVPHLMLSGGLALIGDVSPDCPPEFLAGLAGGEGGWADLLSAGDREALDSLRRSVPPAELATLRSDGWLRADIAGWSGLWHGAPGGWSLATGHGHQDWGSFEVHRGRQPLFVDPGRGSYGEEGEAAYFRSAHAHNGIVVDRHDPYPPNKPYYDDAFRQAVGGVPPMLAALPDGVAASFSGFTRLRGVGAVTRRWRFADDGFAIDDTVAGTGRHTISRYLHSQLPASADGGKVALIGAEARFVVSADVPIAIEPSTRWIAYGKGRPATRLVIETDTALPWRGTIAVKVERV